MLADLLFMHVAPEQMLGKKVVQSKRYQVFIIKVFFSFNRSQPNIAEAMNMMEPKQTKVSWKLAQEKKFNKEKSQQLPFFYFLIRKNNKEKKLTYQFFPIFVLYIFTIKKSSSRG